jgi:Phospholipase_D-nuclease N-terminal
MVLASCSLVDRLLRRTLVRSVILFNLFLNKLHQMELMTPEYSLLLWTLFSLLSLVLSVIALLHIIRNRYLSRRETLGWIIAVLFIPILGSVLYFNAFKKQKQQIN